MADTRKLAAYFGLTTSWEKLAEDDLIIHDTTFTFWQASSFFGWSPWIRCAFPSNVSEAGETADIVFVRDAWRTRWTWAEGRRKKRSKTDKEKEAGVGGRQGKPCQLYLLADLCSAITLPCSRDLFIPIPPHWSGSLSSYIPYMLACLLATLAWWHDWPPKFNSISIFPYLTWIHGQNAREIGKQRVGGI